MVDALGAQARALAGGLAAAPASTLSLNLDVFLDQLAGAGRLVDEGVFTVDLERARERLRRYRLVNPRAYVLQIVMAATRMGARWLHLEASFDGTALSWDGEPLPREALENLWNALLGRESAPGQRLLALALNSCMGLEPQPPEIVVDSARGYRLWMRPQSESVRPRRFFGAKWGTRVCVSRWTQPFFRLGNPVLERDLLARQARLCGLSLLCSRKLVNPPQTFDCQAWSRLEAREPNLEPPVAGSPALARARPAEGDYAAVVMLCPGERGPASARVAVLGVEIGTLTIPGLLPAGRAFVNASGLQVDVAMEQLVENQAVADLRADLAAEFAFLFQHVEGHQGPQPRHYRVEELGDDPRLQRAFVEGILPLLIDVTSPESWEFAGQALRRYLERVRVEESHLPAKLKGLPCLGPWSYQELEASPCCYEEDPGCPLGHPGMPPVLSAREAAVVRAHWGPERVRPAPPAEAEEWWHCPEPMRVGNGKVGFLARLWPSGPEYECRRPAHVWPGELPLEGYPPGLRVTAPALEGLAAAEGLLFPYLFRVLCPPGYLLPYLAHEARHGRTWREERDWPAGLLAQEIVTGCELGRFLADLERFGQGLLPCEAPPEVVAYFGGERVLTPETACLVARADPQTPPGERTPGGERVLAWAPVEGPGVAEGEVAIPEVDQVPLWEVEVEVLAGRRQQLCRLFQPLGFGPVRARIRTPEVTPAGIGAGSKAWARALETVRQSAWQLAPVLLSRLEELAPGRRERALAFLWRMLWHELGRPLTTATGLAQAQLFLDVEGHGRSWEDLVAQVRLGRSLRYWVIEARPLESPAGALVLMVRAVQESLLLRLLGRLVSQPHQLQIRAQEPAPPG